MSHRLSPLLQPRSIAMIGASNNAARIGGMPLDLLKHFGYEGRVFPVNPKYEEIFGYPCYPDIESVPEAPELVVLAIGAADVTAMLRRCHARGARAAIIYAAGFAEMGGEGIALQEELERFAAESGMVVAGPNCMGFANLNLKAYTAFATVFKNVPAQTGGGRASLVTQSGNVCSAVFALMRQLGVEVSHFINTGNEACLEYSEYLEFLAQDDETDCVVGYIEQLRDGRRFVDAALAFAEADKPLILYKAGETEKGSEAVRSHTSALAGNLALYKAGFRQLNVIQGRDFAQMADLAWLSGFRHRAGGKRVAIVTLSGALGAILADKFIAAGLDVPTLPAEVQQALRDGIPDYGMVSNPIDVTGNIVNDPAFVRSVFGALASSDAVDTVVIYASGSLLDRMAEPLLEVCARHPRLFVAIDTGKATCRERLAAGGVPVFTDIGRAVQALAPFCHWLAGRDGVRRWAKLRRETTSAQKDYAVAGLNEYETKRLLGEFGVPAVAEMPAGDADAAAKAAARIGYPVVLKVLSADIAHKTEAGGVRLNLADESQVRQAFAEILASARSYAPQARIDGVLVQAMSKGVAELIAGVTHDPVFGPALTVGLGGVLTELYCDVSHRLLPVDEAMVGEMLGELKAYPLLDGFRGRPKADVAAACGAIAAISRASAALGAAAQEIEINPLQVGTSGAVAIDALLLAP
ncbi:acetate--CoA ligase family protein [Aromatoleum petrolei]|uniref:CoA-binding protein n=1 Tax=Aromatoleum petrolei TaxID=76116 RepID=A0ABX1MU01_9RHOO|nr:acetate--CoA ligase family protein [Aromatoleum petrolei]NMF89564.1 CoA-binding protein [Aromatoleum petrolei]QTQ37341.1 CoA-binding domain-containing protein [Aromatoleum petrolei]